MILKYLHKKSYVRVHCIILSVQLGALTSKDGAVVNPHDGSLTFMGRVLAMLPMDVHLGKLILLGHVFGLMEECIIIG